MICGKTFATGVVSWFFLLSALAASEKGSEKPRIYADPDGRFSFQVLGEWVRIRTDGEKDVVGSFLLTRKVGSERKVVAELLISRVELKPPVSLDEYVAGENKRVMSTPGFRRVGNEQKLTLGGCPAVKNRYVLSSAGLGMQADQKLVHQYHVLKGTEIWGITLTALRQDETVLEQVERLFAESFQFSVPKDVPETSLELLKKVAVTGAKGGFSLTLPDAWQATQSDEEGATIRGPEAVVHGFSVTREEQSPQALAGSFLKERENLKELRVVAQGATEIAGLKGYVVEYSGVAEGRQWHVRLVALADGERVFFVHCVSPEERWLRNKEILERIAQGFSLTPLGPEARTPE